MGACGDGRPSLPGEPCSAATLGCADGLVCCSTDAAALDFGDLSAIVLPIYTGHNEVGGEPLFSDRNNDSSHRGMCIRPGSVPPATVLPVALDCPVPCNPTWSASDIEAVCGQGSLCCQSTELDAKDCVLDPSVGDDGCWRPVTGADIGALTSWAQSEHSTHQDPGLFADGACASLVGGLPAEIDAEAVQRACERRLSVANQQGLCIRGGSFGNICPYSLPSYRDACEHMNDEQGLSGCE